MASDTSDDDSQLVVTTVGNVACVLTISQYLVGISVCRKIIRCGHTADVQFWPTLAMLCSSACWLKYGLLRGDSTLIIVNAVAVGLQSVYALIYDRFTAQKALLYKQLLFGALLVLPVLCYVQFQVPSKGDAEKLLGFYCSTMSIVAYGAPLSSVNHVIRTKSSEVMSMPLVIFNVLLGVLWSLYGYLRHDLFIQVPNLIGLCLSLIQIGVMCKYPSRLGRTIHHLPVVGKPSPESNIT